MIRTLVTMPFSFLVFSFLMTSFAGAQTAQTGIVGHVTDAAGAVVQHARVELQPGATVATTDDDGNFTFSGIGPGTYTLTISNIGFSVFTTRVTVQGQQPDIGRVGADTQLAAMHVRERIAHHPVDVLGAAGHERQTGERDHQESEENAAITREQRRAHRRNQTRRRHAEQRAQHRIGHAERLRHQRGS